LAQESGVLSLTAAFTDIGAATLLILRSRMLPLLAAASAPSVPTPWWGNGLFALLGAIFGGVITAASALFVQERKASREDRIAAEARDRQSDSVRAIIEAGLLELEGYFVLARGRCVVDVVKWRRAIDRVEQWTDKMELAGAFDRQQSRDLILSIHKCESCFETLSRLPSNPWDIQPAAIDEQRMRDVTNYIGAVRGTIQDAHSALDSLLVALGCRLATPHAWQWTSAEIIDQFRRRSERTTQFQLPVGVETSSPEA
jgi:hypothetical protein